MEPHTWCWWQPASKSCGNPQLGRPSSSGRIGVINPLIFRSSFWANLSLFPYQSLFSRAGLPFHPGHGLLPPHQGRRVLSSTVVPPVIWDHHAHPLPWLPAQQCCLKHAELPTHPCHSLPGLLQTSPLASYFPAALSSDTHNIPSTHLHLQQTFRCL